MAYVIQSGRDNSLFEGYIWGGVPVFGWDLDDARKFETKDEAEEVRKTLRDNTTTTIPETQAINIKSIL